MKEQHTIRLKLTLTLRDKGVEGCLLDDRGDANIRDTEEDGVHDNKRFGRRVGHGEECGVHGLRREHSFLLDDVDGGVDVVLRGK